MALIKCPECGKEISDKAEVCIHCGYPVKKMDENIPPQVDKCPMCETKNPRVEYSEKSEAWFCKTCGYNLKIVNPERHRQQIEDAKRRLAQASAIAAAVHCPKCNSTSITTGARGVSGFWGFFGASKTVNRCANCGHTWTPKG